MTTHTTTNMAMMKDPSKSFSGSITQVDCTRNMGEPDKSALPPFLNGKALDTSVSRTVTDSTHSPPIDRPA